MKHIILIIYLLFANDIQAKTIGIFLYSSKTDGDDFYNKFARDLNLKRNMKYKNYDLEYHVTLGFIENIDNKEYSRELKRNLKDLIKPDIENLHFKFGVVSAFGKKKDILVAFPINMNDFLTLNKKISLFLESWKNGDYKLNTYTSNDNYIPHLSLNNVLRDDIKISDLTDIIYKLNCDIYNYSLMLNKLVIKIE